MRLTITYNRVTVYKCVSKALALSLVLLLLAWPAQISHAALAGDADLTFGSMGSAITDFGAADAAKATAIQPDGRIVSAGYTFTAANSDFVLIRHNVDGSLDTSFGNGGKVSTDFGAFDLANDVVLQPDGKIISVGRSADNTSGFTVMKWAIARHNSDGSLDTSFGNNGLVLTQMFLYGDQASGVAIQSDSKIVVAGYAQFPTALRFGFARYNVDGSLDSSFGSEGTLILPSTGFWATDWCHDVVVRPDGKILAAGASRVSMLETSSLMVQLNSDGTVDQSFGNNGYVFTDLAGTSTGASSIALQSDNKIVLAGYSSRQFGLARYNADGTLDSSFGSDGLVVTSFGADDSATGVGIASDGKIIAVGITDASGTAVARYTTDGVLDSSFGSGGKIVTVLPSGQTFAWGMALQSDDKIVVAGSVGGNNTSDLALLRYESISTPDALIGRTTALVNSLNLPDGTSNSLNSKLNDALAEVLAGNDAAACSSLQDFINQVQAQTGKKISESQAQQLLIAANEIRSSIGCQ